MAKRWYVVQTKPNHESIATLNLKDQKFSVFNPIYVHEYKHPKTKKILTRKMPLFPSYVFVQFDVNRHKRWKSINGTRGVVGLVGCYEAFLAPVPKGCVEDIIKRADKNGCILLETAMRSVFEFTPNMKLELVGENYKGLTGTYVSHSQNRVTVLLSLLGRTVRTIIPVTAVQPHS